MDIYAFRIDHADGSIELIPEESCKKRPVGGFVTELVSAKDAHEAERKLRARVAELEAERAELVKGRERLLATLVSVNESTFSHVDGRDLLAELHPRYLIDIKHRIDGLDTWFEGDWLTRLYEAIKIARQAIDAAREGE